MRSWLVVVLCGGFALAVTACGGSNEQIASRSATTPTAPVSPIPCAFTVQASAATLNAAGGATSVTVTTGAECRWTADVAADPWLHVQSGGAFVGPATVSIAVEGNRSFSSRTGTVAIRDARGDVSARQAVIQRAAGCLYTVEPGSVSFDWLGTSDGSDLGLLPVRVHASPSDCRWTATLTVPWMLILNHAESGMGEGSVDVAVLHNSGRDATTSPRVGEVVVAGLSGVNPDARVSVRQAPR